MTLVGFKAKNHGQQIRRRSADADTDDRRTPTDLLAECARLAGVSDFCLDVAASAESAKAPVFYDVAADGLSQPWFGRVWCNPPYSDCGAWVAKAHEEAGHCLRIVMLLPANRTEQRWWQERVEPYRLSGALQVFFLAGRRRFDRPGWTKPKKGDRPPFGLCLLVWTGGH